MTSIQPELWVDSPRDALTFYQAAFGATVLHRVGAGDDIVAQLGVGEAAFWVAPASSTMKRLSPRSIQGQPAGRCWSSTTPRRSSGRPWPPG
jgi:PhnB protein